VAGSLVSALVACEAPSLDADRPPPDYAVPVKVYENVIYESQYSEITRDRDNMGQTIRHERPRRIEKQ
jgi:hypothetical protein